MTNAHDGSQPIAGTGLYVAIAGLPVVLVLDLLLPSQVAVSSLYVVVVMAALLSRSKPVVFAVTTAALALSFVAHLVGAAQFPSPAQSAIAGRLLIAIAIVATAVFGTAVLRHVDSRAGARLQRVLENISEAFMTLSRDWRVTYVNNEAERVLLRPRSELIGKNLWSEFPEAVGSVFQEKYEYVLASGQPAHFQTYYQPLESWLEVHASPSDEGLAVYFRDITQRTKMEERVRQAQRLESVGQLTGGIAHDFNNLLTVIIGNAELLGERLADDRDLAPLVEMIGSAGQRGAELTRHLLAFARKQALAPRPTDIDQLLKDLKELLERALGEDIEIDYISSAGLWKVLVDVGQLQNALLNLALNARDAMQGGGKLTIEASNSRIGQDYAAQYDDVEPGQYVMLAVSDTGSGIDPEHLVQVFDPFFTTKEKSSGSGLGLAMVYGFMKQSGGHVTIYSERGQGTTVRLYVPRTDADIEPRAILDDYRAGDGEKVLLVEDDELLRKHATDQLMALGYTVTAAADGLEALELVRRDERFDLLFTDVVMPGGVSGAELAEKAAQLRPDLKVLFTSGYTENAIAHHGHLVPGVQLLSKPYRREDLALFVRRALGETKEPLNVRQ